MELILSMAYIIHELFDPNLDVYYFLVIILLANDLVRHRKIHFLTIKLIYPLILYGIIQVLLSPNLDIQRLFVNLSKIYLNIYLFIYIKQKFIGFVLIKKITYLISLICLFLIPVSLLYKTKMLWNLNDNINSYNETRLKLFYFEPSELSFHICLIIIILIYNLMQSKVTRDKVLSVIFIVSNTTLVIFSAGIYGIASLLLALFIFGLIYFIKFKNRLNAVFFICIFFLAVSVFYLLASSNNSLYLRTIDIFNGQDDSVIYRYNISYDIMKHILYDTKGFGVGFGNLNTMQVNSIYSSYGLVQVISNSFMYFIAEGGLFSLLFLIVLISLLIKNIHRDGIIKYSLLIFIITYQIAGGYFTNPINWIIYGLICNRYCFNYSKFEKVYKNENNALYIGPTSFSNRRAN